ncbi:MAG: DUF1311 domain-containing protein [Balneola sp.]|nr:MAG: DUF1311 domain-containing protein [Balneola sp.]
MQNLLAILFITFFCTVSSFGQTQTQMNKEAAEAYKIADAELNQVYQKILQEYSSDSSFVEALKVSQRNWIEYRDSELRLKYPEKEQGFYGSVYPMCISYYMTELTTERIEKLQIWLTGIEEGDVCAGSVKRIDPK